MWDCEFRIQKMDQVDLAIVSRNVPPIGFVADTTPAFTRMVYSDFLDRCPNIKLKRIQRDAVPAVVISRPSLGDLESGAG